MAIRDGLLDFESRRLALAFKCQLVSNSVVARPDCAWPGHESDCLDLNACDRQRQRELIHAGVIRHGPHDTRVGTLKCHTIRPSCPLDSRHIAEPSSAPAHPRPRSLQRRDRPNFAIKSGPTGVSNEQHMLTRGSIALITHTLAICPGLDQRHSRFSMPRLHRQMQRRVACIRGTASDVATSCTRMPLQTDLPDPSYSIVSSAGPLADSTAVEEGKRSRWSQRDVMDVGKRGLWR